MSCSVLSGLSAAVLLAALVACTGGGGASDGNGGTASAGGTEPSSGGSSSKAGGTSAGTTGSPGGAASGTGGTGGGASGGQSAGGKSGGTAGNSAGGSGGVSVGPITCRATGDDKSTITLVNQCAQALSFRGSAIEGGELAPGEHACRDVGSATESIPAIRYWGFIGEDPGGEKHTLAELTLNTDFNDFDWYNISHVDAHNLPMQVVAIDMPDCRILTCAESLLEGCPTEGQLRGAGGELISCFSPNRDDPNSTVAQYFEASCDDAYSWSGDDSESVAACAGEDFDVVFCP